MSILLGYEIGTGKPVSIPLAHTAVCGQTQGGKTTTLEALISRSKLRAVAFVTKRDEQSFRESVIHRIAPYFRERADWQFVVAILEACMHQKMNFQRSWIMKLCDGYSRSSGRGKEKTTLQWEAPRSLADVQLNCAAALRTARGLNESVYTELHEFLKLVVPEIGRLPYSETLELCPGLNVMDLRKYSTPLQSLVISSVLEWVYRRERRVVTVIPESWKFIPKDRGSPVRLGAELLIREGAASKNFVWVDSQDLAGVHNVILRQCTVWILGVQRDQHEVKRTLDHIPQNFAKPKRDDVMQLGRGEFYVSYGRECRKVYVQPEWLTDVHAAAIARGEEPIESAARVLREVDDSNSELKSQNSEAFTAEAAEIAEDVALVFPGNPTTAEIEEEEMYKEECERLGAENQRLQREIEELKQTLDGLGAVDAYDRPASGKGKAAADSAPSAVKPADNGDGTKRVAYHADVDELYQEFKARLLAEPEVLAVVASRPRLEVRVTRPTIEADGSTLRGRMALLIAEGWLDEPKSNTALEKELRRRGGGFHRVTVYKEAEKLAEIGFLLKETGGYQAVPVMKRSISIVKSDK